MKKKDDPRHERRQETVKQLFSLSFRESPELSGKASKVAENLKHIDESIKKAAPEWPIERIANTDLAVLRLAVYELLIEKSEPPKVIIDEAVELAKEFGSESSPSFVNGVLGSIVRKEDK